MSFLTLHPPHFFLATTSSFDHGHTIPTGGRSLDVEWSYQRCELRGAGLGHHICRICLQPCRLGPYNDQGIFLPLLQRSATHSHVAT